MAVSSVASSSSFAWPSTSFPLRGNVKLESSSWSNFTGRRNEIYHLAGITGQFFQKSSKPKKGYVFKQRLVAFATSEGEASFTELDSSSSRPENFQGYVQSYSLDSSSSLVTERNQGKPGFISFYAIPDQRRNTVSGSDDIKEEPRVVWLLGPTILVAFLVLPSLYLRKILSIVLEDSLLTDFLILFFTEALFYGGVAIFVLLVHLVWRSSLQVAPKNHIWRKTHLGFRISSVATLALSLIIPLLTMGMVWPWTGPAASATLAPYLVGLVVQFAFEQYARYQKSPAWPVIPVIFQVYRLHQLNRAAQLVTALTFSVRGAETTSQTLAITNSLGTLLTVLQLLGVICIWSLSSFLMRFLPPSDILES